MLFKSDHAMIDVLVNHMIMAVQSNALISIIFMAPLETLNLDYYREQM
jgi:hypothetical protein